MDLNNLINKIDIKQEKENKALDKYTENTDKNREKLETLLSEFKEIINDDAAPELWRKWEYGEVDEYYNYINKKINNFDFDWGNLNLLVSNLPLYQINDIIKNSDENTKFGLFLSALINKNVKAGEKVQITSLMPINFLFYRLENAEAYVNVAGTNLGSGAKNSKICAEEAGNHAGWNMQGCELHVSKVGDELVDGAKNSKIYADEAGNQSGEFLRESELHVKKTGDELGFGAKKSRIYAGKAGDSAGKHMLASKLFIYELNGRLAVNCLTGNNEIYLGKESYEKFPEYRGKVKIWEKKT